MKQILSADTEFKLAKLIRAVADHERDVELLRQMLAELRHFEPYAAFLRLDSDKKEYVTGKDIREFLRYTPLYRHELVRTRSPHTQPRTANSC